MVQSPGDFDVRLVYPLQRVIRFLGSVHRMIKECFLLLVALTFVVLLLSVQKNLKMQSNKGGGSVVRLNSYSNMTVVRITSLILFLIAQVLCIKSVVIFDLSYQRLHYLNNIH